METVVVFPTRVDRHGALNYRLYQKPGALCLHSFTYVVQGLPREHVELPVLILRRDVRLSGAFRDPVQDWTVVLPLR